VAGDKGQWGFVLQGMRPAAAPAGEWWQGAVLIKDKLLHHRLIFSFMRRKDYGNQRFSTFSMICFMGVGIFRYFALKLEF
jgi:hypothetical protein